MIEAQIINSEGKFIRDILLPESPNEIPHESYVAFHFYSSMFADWEKEQLKKFGRNVRSRKWFQIEQVLRYSNIISRYYLMTNDEFWKIRGFNESLHNINKRTFKPESLINGMGGLISIISKVITSHMESLKGYSGEKKFMWYSIDDPKRKGDKVEWSLPDFTTDPLTGALIFKEPELFKTVSCLDAIKFREEAVQKINRTKLNLLKNLIEKKTGLDDPVDIIYSSDLQIIGALAFMEGETYPEDFDLSSLDSWILKRQLHFNEIDFDTASRAGFFLPHTIMN